MIPKDIDKITEADLIDLVDNAVLEHKTLEYKEKIIAKSDNEKKEFLADVSSFANASGGDLIIGIIQDNQTGQPSSVAGIESQNIDQEKLRLESVIRNGIEPRLPSVLIKEVNLANSNTVLIIRILKSWISPHRVVFKSHDKFYSRNSSGKYPLDVTELRLAFNFSDTINERIRNFRTDRIANIIAGETPLPLTSGAKTVLHLIPINSLILLKQYDIRKVTSNPGMMHPIRPVGGWNNRYNLDGFLTYAEFDDRQPRSYVQLYRNGIIEAVDSSMLQPRDGNLRIPMPGYSGELIGALRQYVIVLDELYIETPIIVFLSLLGVKGYRVVVSSSYRDGYEIDRDNLFLPEQIVDNYDDFNAEELFKPFYNALLNAGGLASIY